MMWLSVVLPRPGGPNSSTWSSASPRLVAAPMKICTDARRTLIQSEKKAVLEVKVVDEPVTVVISEKGWEQASSPPQPPPVS